jgi:hypothetical protein
LLWSYQGLCLIALQDREEGLRLIQNGADTEVQDTFSRQTAQLALLQGLALNERYLECRDLAIKFVDKAKDLNLILYARGLLVLGIVQFMLDDPQAEATIQLATENEQLYGGRDLWRCYYALSEVCHDPRLARNHLTQAAKHLKHTLSGLWSHPDVEGYLKHTPYPGRIFYHFSRRLTQ